MDFGVIELGKDKVMVLSADPFYIAKEIGIEKVGMRINLDEIVLQEEVKKTCECFGIDPYKAISEGRLLAAANKKKAKDVVKALKDESIPASIAGEVTREGQGLYIIEKDRKYKLEYPKIDPFWGKFEEYLKK